MKRFLNFDKMITPIIIKVAFWAGLFSSIIFSFFMIGFGILSSSGNIFFVLLGFVNFILGPIVIRIYCEMLIVFFKVQESLVDIRDILDDQKNLTQENEDYSIEKISS